MGQNSAKMGIFVLAMALLTLGEGIAVQEEKERYIIGKEDVLDISVWRAPDLTKDVTVGNNGMIEYSFLGAIQAAGRTTTDLQQELTQKLGQGYIKEPRVNVGVKEYNSKKILVFGEVGAPGLYKIKGNMPVLELLFTVGGVKADAKRMTVIRAAPGDGEVIPAGLQDATTLGALEEEGDVYEVDLIQLLSKGDLSQNIMIYPGDTIYVSAGTGQKFYVLGQITNPGPYEWVQEITVLEAIKMANGPTDMAALNRIKVRRSDRKKEIRVNMVDIMRGKKKDDVVIYPGDTIVVPRSWI